jgi:hypothetical protein
MTVEERAAGAAGNWRKFQSFGWHDKPDEPEQWAIVYTSNRDSGLLDQCNAAVVQKALEPFAEADPADVRFESHSHWAVGYVDGFSIRVYRAGEITPAFRVLHDLEERKENYPVLDESAYSEMEVNATLENIKSAAWSLEKEYALPDGWEGRVYDKLPDRAKENRDDQGGYPEEEDLRAAFKACRFKRRREVKAK